jgi:hypothetical protein
MRINVAFCNILLDNLKYAKQKKMWLISAAKVSCTPSPTESKGSLEIECFSSICSSDILIRFIFFPLINYFRLSYLLIKKKKKLKNSAVGLGAVDQVIQFCHKQPIIGVTKPTLPCEINRCNST